MAKYVDYYDWKVQLAYAYKPGMLELGEWISISKKINGVRATFYDNNLVSRSGKIFHGFNNIIKDLKALTTSLDSNLVFDGELCLKEKYKKNMSDNEAFKVAAGIANSSVNMENKYKLKFIIFDIIHETAFETRLTASRYNSRSNLLLKIKDIIKDNENVSIVPIVYRGKDHNKIETVLKVANNAGWEGIMINRNLPYQFKRTKNILKYKTFNTIDLEIVELKEGEGKYTNTLGAIGCKYKNNIVYVGTGFDDLTRNDLWHKGSELLGKICEVKYKDITNDKSTMLPSLQFPVFVCIREDKTESDD